MPARAGTSRVRSVKTHSGPGFGVSTHPDTLTEPLKWRKPQRVFVNSMSDLFHADIPDGYTYAPN
jgi:protein gp37